MSICNDAHLKCVNLGIHFEEMEAELSGWFRYCLKDAFGKRHRQKVALGVCFPGVLLPSVEQDGRSCVVFSHESSFR